jgi:hypothetical protein
MAKPRRNRTIKIVMQKTEAAVYTSPRIADALEDILAKATLFEGVRIGQILEAVYKQGKKDGAREAIEEWERGLLRAKKEINHKNPGRPRKTKS